jgi:hypothetical protein
MQKFSEIRWFVRGRAAQQSAKEAHQKANPLKKSLLQPCYRHVTPSPESGCQMPESSHAESWQGQVKRAVSIGTAIRGGK